MSAAHGKIIPPFTLDETLTFFCPQENVEALDQPAVRELHDYMLNVYQPPVGGGNAVMLMLPCTKTKPYSLSAEHQAINTYLLSAGFTLWRRPTIRANLKTPCRTAQIRAS